MKAASRMRFESGLTWDRILMQYEELLESWSPALQEKSISRELRRSDAETLHAVEFSSRLEIANRSINETATDAQQLHSGGSAAGVDIN
jgi:hypothetical protein